MTINEILKDAFERIQKEHRIAISRVEVESIGSAFGAPDERHITRISFDGDALRPLPLQEDSQ
ncbi:MAG TPA: hypothetical protein VIC08_02905 [Cellvibrionaceae bacterium]